MRKDTRTKRVIGDERARGSERSRFVRAARAVGQDDGHRGVARPAGRGVVERYPLALLVRGERCGSGRVRGGAGGPTAAGGAGRLRTTAGQEQGEEEEDTLCEIEGEDGTVSMNKQEGYAARASGAGGHEEAGPN